MKQLLLTFAGAIAGGILGYFAFYWMATQNFYALILPGGLLGAGAGLGRNRRMWPALVAGLLAILLGLFTEWRFFPFKKDESLTYFLIHFYELKPVTLIMIALGGALGFYLPYSRMEEDYRRYAPREADKADPEPPAAP